MNLRGELVGKVRRCVVKIGSTTLAKDPDVYARIAQSVAALRTLPDGRKHVAIVSSGAIALGMQTLGFRSRPQEVPKLQACAAAGQSELMRRYENAFAAHSISVAQVLLTHADLADRTRGNNARAALEELFECGVVPIVNENDTVSTDEIKFGDNDQLAAIVSALVSADLLVLLSDVPGLLDDAGARVSIVHDFDREAFPLVRVKKSEGMGTGGMASKLESARRGTLAGAVVVIGDARDANTLSGIFNGEDVGTLFVPPKSALRARKHWIVFTLRPRGAIVVDDGAKNALETRGSSLLAVGILGVRGSFSVGDAISIVDAQNHEIGRGLPKLSAVDIARVAGHRQVDCEAILGRAIDAIVDRDDLVIHAPLKPDFDPTG